MTIQNKKLLKIILIVLVIFLAGKYAFELRYGTIDYTSAFEIAYQETDKGKTLMKSDWYQLESDRRWLNFRYKPGCGQGGYFISLAGAAGYDYSSYAPYNNYLESDSIHTVTEKTINNTLIKIIESENDVAIYLPMQGHKGMTSQFLIWPMSSGKEMKEELIEMVSTMEFHPRQYSDDPS